MAENDYKVVPAASMSLYYVVVMFAGSIGREKQWQQLSGRHQAAGSLLQR